MVHVAEWPDDAAMTGSADRGQGWPEAGGDPGTDAGPSVAGRAGADSAEGSEVRQLLQSSAWQARDLDWERLVEVARGLGPDPELAKLSDQDLDRRFRVQAAELAAQTCRWMELLAELVVRGVWAVPGCRTPATWLSWTISMAPSTAREHVRVALQLRELPLIRERFREGSISFSKVRALTRVAVPEIEPMLLNWADGATAAEIERVVRGFRSAQRARSADAADREARRGVSERLESDGTITVMIRVLPDEAAEVRAAIDRLVDLERSAEEAQAASSDRQEELLPDDLSPDDPSLDGAAGSATNGRGDAGQDTARTYAGKRVDVVLQALAAAVADGAPDTSGLDRHTLVLSMEAADLVEPDAVAPSNVPAADPHGRTRTMNRAALRRLACDAGLVTVVRDGDGTPMDIGGRDRRLTAALRRAVTARDRSCRFPGCGATRHLHAHHIQHWADGGPTDLANLVVVCGYHHRFVHDHGWRIDRVGTGRFTFAPPGGEALPAASKLPGPGERGSQDMIAGPSISDPFLLRPDEWPGPGYANIDMAVAVLDQELRHVLPPDVVAA